MRSGEFRADLDPRLAALAILGMANAAAGWYRKEEAPIERIADGSRGSCSTELSSTRRRRTRRRLMRRLSLYGIRVSIGYR